MEDKDMELEKAKQLLKELVTRDSEYIRSHAYKTCFMLKSAEHEIETAHKY